VHALSQVLLVVSNRRNAASRSQCKVDDTQLEFSESMRRTHEAVARTGCLSRWCCVADTQDKYAVDVLATEIDSLKRAVREVRPDLQQMVTFRVSRRRREMYCGHARLCVCLSALLHFL